MDDGTPATMRVQPMSFAQAGDELLAARVTMQDIPFVGTMEIDAVYIRRGDVITTILNMALGLEGVDSELTEMLVNQAVEKVEKAYAD